MESGSDDDDPAIDPDHGLALVKAEAEAPTWHCTYMFFL